MKPILTITITIAALALSFIAGRVTAGVDHATPLISTVTDTLYIRDTITITKPQAVKTRVTDTLRIAVSDTVRVTDTLYIRLPRTAKTYEGKDYRAVVSGVMPSLDTISVFPQSSIITKTVTVPAKDRRRWGLGLQAGYGATKDGLTPYIGIGVSYNLVRW